MHLALLRAHQLLFTEHASASAVHCTCAQAKSLRQLRHMFRLGAHKRVLRVLRITCMGWLAREHAGEARGRGGLSRHSWQCPNAAWLPQGYSHAACPSTAHLRISVLVHRM